MNRRLIIQLQRRSLADYAVFMTICGVGAFLIAMIVIALASDSLRIPARFQFATILALWLILMFYLWLHFRAAARRAQLAPSSTALFHTIQYVAVGFAALSFLFSRALGWLIFIVISFGVEVALGAFFLCYIFLALTLCGHVPSSSIVGLAAALIGVYFSYQHVLTLAL
jgi:hypothetical protein